MIQVLVSGALGRMGTEICKAVDGADDMTLVGGVDPAATDDTTIGSDDAPVFASLKTAIEVTRPDIVIDFTRPDVAEANVRCALEHGVNCVLGTTGLSEERLREIYDESATGDAALFHAPNFTTGAVLMMLFSQTAAKYFPDVRRAVLPGGRGHRVSPRRQEGRPLRHGHPHRAPHCRRTRRGGRRAGQGDRARRLRGRTWRPDRRRSGACRAHGRIRRASGSHLRERGPDAHHTS